MTMQLAVRQFTPPTDRRLQFIKQLGVDSILLDAGAIPGETHWAFRDLLHLRTRCEDGGVRIVAIENIPRKFCERAMLGLPGRDEEIERIATTIRNIGQAGIPSLAYAWMFSYCRTSSTTRGRGGAKVTSFDMALAQNAPPSAGRIYTEDEMWANYEYFIRAIVPVAEEAGVRLALHPDDPPVESLDGVARIFRDFDAFKRAIEIVDSPVHGLHFCIGCWSEMGARVLDAIRYFGEGEKIFSVHFRDVQGTVPKFQECFVDEGNLDMAEVLKTLKEAGFTGILAPDHVPHMVGDTRWGHRARAYTIGYMKGLLKMLG